MTATLIGVCRLCHQEGVELVRSHIIPAWAYRRVCDDPGAPKLEYSAGRVAFTYAQVKEPMLCQRCEQRFHLEETYVAELAYSRGRFPLLERIASAPILGRDGNRIHWVSAIGALDPHRLVYFGVSVIWRAAVAEEVDAGKPKLGEKYGEVFRRFLLDQIPFPSDARMQVSVMARHGGTTSR
jgi:hypothetical protein